MTDRERDRTATEDRLIAAVLDLVAEGGQGALGVNAVARAAGCDKQLVYRYFSGMEGLCRAAGLRLGEALVAKLAPHIAPAGCGYQDQVRALLHGLIEAYRASPALIRIKLGEWSGDPALAALAEGRGRALGDWVRRHLPPPPDGVDAPATNALLIGAVDAAALSALAPGRFAGLPLATQADWDRLCATLDRMVAAVYAPGG